MFYGAGQLFFATTDIGAGSVRGENLMFPGCIASFELAFEDNFIEAKCLIDGVRSTVASQITESIPTLTLTFELQDWATTQLLYDEVAAQQASVVLPELRVQVTDGSGVLTDADILGTETVNTDIYFFAADCEKFLLASDVVLAAGTATFAALPNQTIQYVVYVTKTNVESIGVVTPFDRFGKLLFSGIAYSTETSPNGSTQIIINGMNRTNSPTLTVNGDLNEISIEYRPAIQTGKRTAVEFYNLNPFVC